MGPVVSFAPPLLIDPDAVRHLAQTGHIRLPVMRRWPSCRRPETMRAVRRHRGPSPWLI